MININNSIYVMNHLLMYSFYQDHDAAAIRDATTNKLIGVRQRPNEHHDRQENREGIRSCTYPSLRYG